MAALRKDLIRNRSHTFFQHGHTQFCLSSHPGQRSSAETVVNYVYIPNLFHIETATLVLFLTRVKHPKGIQDWKELTFSFEMNL